jgi:3-phosphoshikimate 1-carboxyvinyltransferase
MHLDIRPCSALRGEVKVPGDKSISHRALIFGAIAQGVTRIDHINPGEDVSSTATCLMKLGVDIRFDGRIMLVAGKDFFDLQAPKEILDAKNSGTTMRLLAGLLAAQDFSSMITGDDSLRRRPMRRIIEPLKQMGAQIDSNDGYPPLHIHGSELNGIEYEMPIASAQVKSCLLIAGLGAWGTTAVIEKEQSRDHTERMLHAMGAPISKEGKKISIRPGKLHDIDINVPGDISAAAFFIAAALLVPDSDIFLPHVGINPTRTGFLDIVREMGAHLKITGERDVCGEPVANIRAQSCELQATEISGARIPLLIDEIPIIAVLATHARGKTIIRDAAELRVKESDRLKLIANNLRSMGASVEEFPDGLSIIGPTKLHGAEINTAGDHRLAMAFTIAGLVASGVTRILQPASVTISDPDFYDSLGKLGVNGIV